jgi:hypothetical protein
MGHAAIVKVDIEKVIESEPLSLGTTTKKVLLAFLALGFLTLVLGVIFVEPKVFWGTFYVNTLFWLGLSAGGVMTTVIFQIVRARWSASLRRIAEANISFFPWALLALACTYLGKEVLFPWGREPMPGREWYMQADFVYARFFVLLSVLYFAMRYFVRLSLREDIGMLRETRPSDQRWFGHGLGGLVKNWRGKDVEIPAIQHRLSCFAPVLVFLYAVIYSLFAFEMIMAMDKIWYSNMFGGWNFVANVLMGWTSLILLVLYFAKRHKVFAENVSKSQLWDLGKLTLGFSMLWAYMFLAQYLPQWYGNLPEETQWLLLRVTGLWKPLAYVTFACCFIFPFIWMASEDVKKTPWALSLVCVTSLTGIWLEKYMVVQPQLTPAEIPLLANFGMLEIGIFLGFLGAYGLSIGHFLHKYPYIAIAHPLTKGINKW